MFYREKEKGQDRNGERSGDEDGEVKKWRTVSTVRDGD